LPRGKRRGRRDMHITTFTIQLLAVLTMPILVSQGATNELQAGTQPKNLFLQVQIGPNRTPGPSERRFFYEIMTSQAKPLAEAGFTVYLDRDSIRDDIAVLHRTVQAYSNQYSLKQALFEQAMYDQMTSSPTNCEYYSWLEQWRKYCHVVATAETCRDFPTFRYSLGETVEGPAYQLYEGDRPVPYGEPTRFRHPVVELQCLVNGRRVWTKTFHPVFPSRPSLSDPVGTFPYMERFLKGLTPTNLLSYGSGE